MEWMKERGGDGGRKWESEGVTEGESGWAIEWMRGVMDLVVEVESVREGTMSGEWGKDE